MHGIIMHSLQQFITENHGRDTWKDLVERAGAERNYLASGSYPDEHAIEIIEAASDATGESPFQLQKSFGKHLASDLTDVYGTQIDDDWSFFDLLERTEQQIHEVVRLDKPDADPPELDATRVDDETVEIEYTSDRRMCGILEGIVHALADVYDESIRISHDECMRDHDHRCLVTVSA